MYTGSITFMNIVCRRYKSGEITSDITKLPRCDSRELHGVFDNDWNVRWFPVVSDWSFERCAHGWDIDHAELDFLHNVYLVWIKLYLLRYLNEKDEEIL